MPVARIYASLVEEAEPICADLLARGYDVEVVFPDAVLSNPADLELRVERCSAEEAIARVEAVGSPSRCVFVTPVKGSRRELLLVEMTVLGNGTRGRHPLSMPAIPLVTERFPGVATVSANAPKMDFDVAETPPFADTSQLVPATGSSPRAADTGSVQVPLARRREDRENLSKDMIAELNSFLAHAPVVDRPEGFHLRIFQNVRDSRGITRARKNWEGLTLLAVAASLVLLLSLGWYAAPDRPRHMAVSVPEPAALTAATVAPQASNSMMPVTGIKLKPVVLETRTAGPVVVPASFSHRRQQAPARGEPLVQDDLVAQDRIVRMHKGRPDKPSPLTATASDMVRPAAIRSAPIKRITDLK